MNQNSKEYLWALRHTCQHVLTQAMENLYGQDKVIKAMGPATEEGFYFDFDTVDFKVSEDMFLGIEAEMQKIISHDLPLVQSEIGQEEAKKLFSNNIYKLEWINQFISESKKLTVYKTGDEYTDLCAGPHVESTGKIGAFKLLSIAGAYWHGSEKNKMLTRIYGTAFQTAKELEDYLHFIEEAKLRDHRLIGEKQKLYTISPLVGAGLPLMQPNGMIIREAITDYLWSLHKNLGYQKVWTPHIAKVALYETSGHAAKFGDELFRVKGKEEEFIMKPMNCPHHMQIFADNQFSYRDMPIRYFEPATVYRDEKPGQLLGLARVRSITQDDGHIFCRISQLQEEIGSITKIIQEFYTTLGMLEGYWVSLSVRGEDKSKYIGTEENWLFAEESLEIAAKANNLNYRRIEGEAAFYGPKLDFMFKDALGRERQLATVQCDFNLPERFNLSFINEQGQKERPVVIHRAVSGSLERFMSILIEHFAGAFPLWLSPTQVSIIPITEDQLEYANTIATELKKHDIRCNIQKESGTMQSKIKDAQELKIPYMLILGKKEQEANTVSIRTRENKQIFGLSLQDLVSKLNDQIQQKSLALLQ